MKTNNRLPEDLNPSWFSNEVLALIPGLMAEGAQGRREARKTLAEMGPGILDQIYRLLDSSDNQIRWEAAQILKVMAPGEAIPKLTGLLTDDDDDVRWIAAEALINVGREALIPLLRLVVKHVENPDVRDGAHHVLTHLLTKEERRLNKKLLHGLSSYKRYGDTAPHWADALIDKLRKDQESKDDE